MLEAPRNATFPKESPPLTAVNVMLIPANVASAAKDVKA